MPSDEELSPEEKLLKVIQDDGQVEDDASEAATTAMPSLADESAPEEPEQPEEQATVEGGDADEDAGEQTERRLRLADREPGEAAGDGSAAESIAASDTDETSGDAAAEPAGAGAAGGLSGPTGAAERTAFSVAHVNKILAVAVFILIGVAFFEIASGFGALKNELGGIDRAISSGSKGASIKGDDIEGVGDLQLSHINNFQKKRPNFWTPDNIPPQTEEKAPPVNYCQVLKDNVEILFTSGDSEVYLKRKQGDAIPDFYSVGAEIQILKYYYKIESVSRESVCFQVNDESCCLQ